MSAPGQRIWVNPEPVLFAVHDSGIAAWTIVAGYAAAAILCGVAARRSGARFWWLAAAILLALGINKPLDLQTELTFWMRRLARVGGWYTERRVAEHAFVAGCAAAAAIASYMLLRRLRYASAPERSAALGLLLLGGYVLLRAATFYHLIGTGRTAHSLSGLEPAGILIAGGGAVWSLVRSRASR